ncbi:hypothetical protein IV203_031152 [Nitzschia inconspicua]|uniref:Uncharacterized protein n=1 Tax=Nitzschia inconspicua TaxID=303405 RepID=A0A9K3LUT0_9STRA|nr:hypothetical protein IV203_031152 [Nitzschia inconspicua]
MGASSHIIQQAISNAFHQGQEKTHHDSIPTFISNMLIKLSSSDCSRLFSIPLFSIHLSASQHQETIKDKLDLSLSQHSETIIDKSDLSLSQALRLRQKWSINQMSTSQLTWTL